MRVGHADGSQADRASPASDVYMVGSLAYELLTAGEPPFHWASGNSRLLRERLTSTEPVRVPGTHITLPSLATCNVLEAAAVDGVPIPWCVRVGEMPGSADRLEATKGLMAECLSLDPAVRPTLPLLLSRLRDLLAREEGVAGTGGPRVSTVSTAGVCSSVPGGAHRARRE